MTRRGSRRLALAVALAGTLTCCAVPAAAAAATPLVERWRVTAEQERVYAPLVADGVVYAGVGGIHGPRGIVAVDLATGTVRWTRDLGDAAQSWDVDGGKVVVAATSTVRAFDAATGEPAWTRREWPGQQSAFVGRDVVAAGGRVYAAAGFRTYALDPADGSVEWDAAVDGSESLALDGQTLYVRGIAPIAALRAGSGIELWRRDAPPSADYDGLAAHDGLVYLGGSPGLVLDGATGDVLRRPVFSGRPTITAGTVYALYREIGAPGAVIEAADADDGAFRWDFGALSGVRAGAAVAHDTVYALGAGGSSLYGLDRAGGDIGWCAATGVAGTVDDGGLVAGGGAVVAAVGGTLLAYEPGGAGGCDYYGVSVPGYHSPLPDPGSPQSFAPAAFVRSGDEGAVRFTAAAPDYRLTVGAGGAMLAMPRRDGLPGGPVRVGLQVRGGVARAVEPAGRLPGVVNRYVGADPSGWTTGLARYRRVRLEDVRPGVDLVLRRAAGERFEYDLVVAPGAAPESVALTFTGASRPRVDGSGALVLDTPAGPLRQPPPVAYQRAGGIRRRVAAAFRVHADGTVGFRVGRYDPDRTLVVDPVLEWSSYFGGGLDETGAAVATDPSGAVYLGGGTISRDLPAFGALDAWNERNALCRPGPEPCTDAFVAKYGADGRLVYVTYLASPGDDAVRGIAADAAGHAYVTGKAGPADFPATRPPAGTPCSGGPFAAKLAPDGSRLEYSLKVGSCGSHDVGEAVAVDSRGRAVIVGGTRSHVFPTTPDASDARCAGWDQQCQEAFVVRVAADGSGVDWATLLGGDVSREHAYDVALDGRDRPVVVGEVSGWYSRDFPATPGSYDPEPSDHHSDMFAARLRADGTAIEWATAFGGWDFDAALGVALDADHDLHVAGMTRSDDFPTTAGAYDRQCALAPGWCENRSDAVALELSADGSRLLASTFLGGEQPDQAAAIAVDALGRAYLTGTTTAWGDEFPQVNAFQPPRTGRRRGGDAFVLRLSADKSVVEDASLLGGGTDDAGADIALAGEDAWIAGTAQSFDLPTTAGAPQPVAAGGNCSGFRDPQFEYPPCADAFLARIGPGAPPAPGGDEEEPPPAPGGDEEEPPPATDDEQVAPPATAGDEPPPAAPLRRAPLPSPDRSAPAGEAAPAVGWRRRSLRVAWGRHRIRGRVRTRRGARACARRAPVVLERRRHHRWKRLARKRARRSGAFRFRAPRGRRVVRVRAPRVRRTLESGARVRCRRASRRLRPPRRQPRVAPGT